MNLNQSITGASMQGMNTTSQMQVIKGEEIDKWIFIDI